MSWKIEKAYNKMHLITRDDGVVAGSIVQASEHRWFVEVLWSGPGGDIVYEAPSMAAAEAFVAGVGAMFEAMRGSTGWERNLLPADSSA